MKKLNKILFILVIFMIFCINFIYAVNLTNDSFYTSYEKVNKGCTIKSSSTSDTSFNSSSSFSLADETGKLTSKKEGTTITYYYNNTNLSSQPIEMFTETYNIENNQFTYQLNSDYTQLKNSIESYQGTNEEEANNLLIEFIAYTLTIAERPTAIIISLADSLNMNLGNAYGYYVETRQKNSNTDNKIINFTTNEFEYNENSNENGLNVTMKVNLDEFSKIDSSYLSGETSYQIILGPVSDEEDDEPTDEPTDEPVNEQNNANGNNQGNPSKDLVINLNDDNNNENKQVTNTSNDKNKYPNAGYTNIGILVIIFIILSIYFYLKYNKYNKMLK